MAISEQKRLRFERTGFAALAGMLCALLIVFEIMPKTERALLLKNDAPFQAKAFSATVTPLDPRIARVESDTLNRLSALSDATRRRNFGRRGTNGRAAGGAPDRQVFADAGLAPFTGQAPDSAANLASPGPPATSDGPGTSGGFSSAGGSSGVASQPGPLGAAPGTSSTTSSTSGGTTSTGSTSTSTGGVTSTGSTLSSSNGGTTPVSSVPEPGTWLTMLLGFFMMGAAIRRTSMPQSARSVGDHV